MPVRAMPWRQSLQNRCLERERGRSVARGSSWGSDVAAQEYRCARRRVRNASSMPAGVGGWRIEMMEAGVVDPTPEDAGDRPRA